MERARPRGFTLIELMIVVAIIGILAAIAIPKFADLLRKADEGATRGNLGALRSMLNVYYGDMEGNYPSKIGALTINGKYTGSLPYTKLRPYHPNYNVGTMTATFPGTEYGSWWYNNAPSDANFGEVRINCSHTDSKSSVWSSY